MGLLLLCHWLCLQLCAKWKNGKGKIFDIVIDMAKILPGMDEQEETKDSNFVFVMDNYFTLPKVVGEAGL